jgi:integrase
VESRLDRPAFARAITRTDLSKIRFLGLRHRHATDLLAAGRSVKEVSDRLGHASNSFTLDTYGHLMPGQQRDGALAAAQLVLRAVTIS